MPNHFSDRFKNKTDSELFIIVDAPKKHVPEAVEAAIEELRNRKNGNSKYIDPQKLLEEKRKLVEVSHSNKKRKSKANFRFTKSFIKLILRPDTHRIRTTNSNRLLLTLRFYFLTILFLLVASIPLTILVEIGLLTYPRQFGVIPDSIDKSSDLFLTSLLIPIIAGVLEESQFRLVLYRFNKKYFDIFISLFTSYLIVKLFGQYFTTYAEFYSGFLVQSAFIYLLFAIVIYFSLSRSNAHSWWFEKNWQIAYKYLFYSLAFIFSIAHLPTIDLTIEHLIFWPLVILPFFIYAMIFSYVRIRIGFQYAILLHFTIDLIVIIIRR